MKAVSPVRSLRQADAAIRSLSESSHAIGSGSAGSGTELALDSLLYDMNGCYSRLRQLVPSLATSRKASKMEILQHVIDYILDLQVALDAEPVILQWTFKSHVCLLCRCAPKLCP
uniref:Inhibitor of DNA binding 2b n=1 Tax=Eptatretus burgeri TaxID=7764 RepID=A0A8C4Q4G5_EPTBU